MRTIISAAYEPVSATISASGPLSPLGFNLSRCCLQWAFYELATNPSIQSQLREEIGAAAPSGDPASLDHPTLVGLPLLDAVIKECLRLHPPIIENHHEVSPISAFIFILSIDSLPTRFKAAATVSIPRSPPHPPGVSCEPIKILRGGLIVIPVNVLHISKEIWGEDAEIFNPSRWLSQDSQEPTSSNSSSSTIRQHAQAQASSLLAFSAG